MQPPYGQQPGQHPHSQQPHAQPGQPAPGQPYQAPAQAAMQQAPPAAGDPKVQAALQQVDLLQGEQVIYTLTADGFFLGANPILKMIGAFQNLMTTLCCGHNDIFLIVTNQRVLVIRSFKNNFIGAIQSKSVMSVAVAGLKEVGSSKDTIWWCFHTRTVQLQTMTQTFNLVIKRFGDQEIRQFVSNVAQVTVASSNRSGV